MAEDCGRVRCIRGGHSSYASWLEIFVGFWEIMGEVPDIRFSTEAMVFVVLVIFD